MRRKYPIGGLGQWPWLPDPQLHVIRVFWTDFEPLSLNGGLHQASWVHFEYDPVNCSKINLEEINHNEWDFQIEIKWSKKGSLFIPGMIMCSRYRSPPSCSGHISVNLQYNGGSRRIEFNVLLASFLIVLKIVMIVVIIYCLSEENNLMLAEQKKIINDWLPQEKK